MGLDTLQSRGDNLEAGREHLIFWQFLWFHTTTHTPRRVPAQAHIPRPDEPLSMTTVRQAHTVWRLLCCHPPPPLRCPSIVLRVAAPRPISTLQSRPPLRVACTSRLVSASPCSFARHSSTDSAPPGASFVKNPSSSEDQDAPQTPPATPSHHQFSPLQEDPYKKPTYELTFTCKPCGHRSSHTITQQAYHFGTILIRCPGCKDRHVISDHLKVGERPLVELCIQS